MSNFVNISMKCNGSPDFVCVHVYCINNKHDMVLRTATFNCHGFKSDLADIQDICENHDIIFQLETWLYISSAMFIMISTVTAYLQKKRPWKYLRVGRMAKLV